MLTKSSIMEKITEIKKAAGDDEVQHSIEDCLEDSFILSLTSRKDKVGDLAKLVISTNEIKFSRWCG